MKLHLFATILFFQVANANVSSQGHFGLNYQIDIPAGTQNVNPNISISYNETISNGLLGPGFNIDGFSKIIRKPNRNNKISFSGKDKFISESGTFIYHPLENNYSYEYENYERMEAGKCAGSDKICSWQIKNLNGSVASYGLSENSRTSVNANNNILSWNIEKFEIANGLSYKIDYTNFDDMDHELVPKSIIYTIGKGISKHHKVNFFYQDRKDIIEKFSYGKRLVIKKRLKQIVVKTEDYLNKIYEICYVGERCSGKKYEGLSYIDSINTINRIDKRTVESFSRYSWDFSETKIIPSELNYPNNKRIGSINLTAPLTVDFDGDGDIDIGRLDKKILTLYVSNASKGSNNNEFTVRQVNLPINFNVDPNRTQYGTADFNADGLQDIYINYNNSLCILENRSTPNKVLFSLIKRVTLPIRNEYPVIFDANNDSLPDIIQIKNNSMSYLFASLDESEELNFHNFHYTIDNNSLIDKFPMIGHYNSDDLLDYIFFDNSGNSYLLESNFSSDQSLGFDRIKKFSYPMSDYNSRNVSQTNLNNDQHQDLIEFI